jgi:hypothetical protein
MPILHIFSSKPKQKKGERRPELLENCISLHLSEEIRVGISLASEELGHEVTLFESDNFICGILPIAMRNSVFLDKHRSRFRRANSSSRVTFQDQQNVSNSIHSNIEQNDAARHLLFVLSAAITFPLPRGDVN